MLDSKAYTEALEVIPEKYLLVNVISKRLRQLQRGAEPRLSPEECEGFSNLQIALEEIRTKKITLVATETLSNQ